MLWQLLYLVSWLKRIPFLQKVKDYWFVFNIYIYRVASGFREISSFYLFLFKTSQIIITKTFLYILNSFVSKNIFFKISLHDIKTNFVLQKSI